MAANMGPPIDRLPFIIVEEGLKKNKASDSLRNILSLKISQRADIEMEYIRLLQAWEDGLVQDLNQKDGTAVYMENEISKALLYTMREEASGYIQQRQNVYNRLMLDDGPYCMMQQATAVVNGQSIHLGTERLKDDLYQMNKDRQRIEDKWQKLKQCRDSIQLEIESLEQKLAQRSRLSAARRGLSFGKRKVDHMRDELARLRQIHDSDTEKMSELESHMTNFKSHCIQKLDAMDVTLREIESHRVRLMLQQIKGFIQDLYGSDDSNKALRRGVLKNCITRLDQADRHLVTHWSDVAVNAKYQTSGLPLTELFNSAKANSASGQSNALLLFNDPFITDFTSKKQPVPTKQPPPTPEPKQTENVSANSKEDQEQFNVSPTSSHSKASSVSEKIDEDLAVAPVPTVSSIESIELPEEPPRPLKRPFQPREFLPEDNSKYGDKSSYRPYDRTSVQPFQYRPSKDEKKYDLFTTPIHRTEPIRPALPRDPRIPNDSVPLSVGARNICAEAGPLIATTNPGRHQKEASEIIRDKGLHKIYPQCGRVKTDNIGGSSGSTQDGSEHLRTLGQTFTSPQQGPGNSGTAGQSLAFRQDSTGNRSDVGSTTRSSHDGATVDRDKIGLLREIRVVAIQDYRSSRKTDLNLKKGQVIKQKAGKNEEGFCYGWTRETPLSPKKYGHYPVDAVAFL